MCTGQRLADAVGEYLTTRLLNTKIFTTIPVPTGREDEEREVKTFGERRE